MLRTWIEPEEIVIPADYMLAISGNPLVSQVLYSRGIRDIDTAKGFLSPQYYHPAPSSELPGLPNAVELLRAAITSQKVIGVWGDFDVDGQTSTTLLVSALHKHGANVKYHIPVRAEESHGISLPALQKFIEQGVDIILTCDTGISSNEAIAYARSKGIVVIITDHHDLPEVLPDAKAIVNPKLLPEDHPLASLPGVGVAYKLVEELDVGFGDKRESGEYLDLVALGLVADIALLRGDNRYLLQLGLEAMRRTKRAGLVAIMELVELNQANLTEEHIGYILAPRMNALGRLDDANSMVELLTTTDMGRARVLALELEGMNAQRKLLSDQVYQAAQSQIEADPKLLEYPVLILSHPNWPAGVVGIVASRLVEQYHRPAILLSSPPGRLARGSARSIEGINITSVIASNQSLVNSFGGHPMAAGLAIDPENIPAFRHAIARTVLNLGVGVQVEKDLQVDSYLTLPELSLDLVEDLERLAPFGAGNPPLVFATRNLKLTGYAAVGRSGEHLQLSLEDEMGHIQRSIWWQGAGYTLPGSQFDLAYSVRASTYRGQREVQIEWIDYRQTEEALDLAMAKNIPIEVADYRNEIEPYNKLKKLMETETILVWGEAGPGREAGCLDRNSLSQANSLAIWTIPPGPNELQNAIMLVNPRKIILFGIDPGMDNPEDFLKRLAGLVKNRIKSHQGMVDLEALAAATAQRTPTVRVGLDWLADRGYISLLSLSERDAHLAEGDGGQKGDAQGHSAYLNTLLAESSAFRRYYLTAQKDRLVRYEEH